MKKIVVDLMEYTNRPLLMMGMINVVKAHHEGFDKWVTVGPIKDDVDGFNTLSAVAERHVETGDFVIVLFEVESLEDRTFDQFVFKAFAEWGPITVWTEPTIVT